MRCALLVSLVVVAASPALAQRTVSPPPELAEPPLAPPPGGIAVSGERMAISPSACVMLAMLAEDVPGADYVPGVDARGNPVAPADLPNAATADPGVAIEIAPELRRRFNLAERSPLWRAKAGSGLITLRDGRAYFNGSRLADNERDMLLAACREGRRPRP